VGGERVNQRLLLLFRELALCLVLEQCSLFFLKLETGNAFLLQR